MLNILFLNFSESSHIIKWGQEKLIAELLAGLSKKKQFKIHFLINRPVQNIEYYSKYDVNIICSNFQKFFPLKEFYSAVNYIKKNSVDIIHSNETRSNIFSALFKIACPHVKLISSKHDKDIFYTGSIVNLLRKRLYLGVERLLFLLFYHRIITPLNAIKKCIVGKFYFIKNKVIVIPYGIGPLSIKKNRIKKQVKKIAVIGRLENFKKAQDVFIKAVNYIEDDVKKKIDFHIVGDGPDLRKLKKMRDSYKLSNYIKLNGYIDQIQTFVADLDIAVISSHFEGLPLILMNYIHFGIPVIVSNIPELTEIIEDQKTGLVFKAGDEQDLAEKMAILINDVKLRKNISNNLKKQVHKYILDRMVNEYKKVYCNAKKI